MGPHTFSNAEELSQFHFVGDTCAGSSGNEHTFYFGEFSLEVVGKTEIKFVTDDHAENGVAEKFEPFITQTALVCDGSVNKGYFKQFIVFKLITNDLLAQRLR